MSPKDHKAEQSAVEQPRVNMIEQIFNDPEAKRNIVGLYDLLLKIAKKNSKLWAEIQQPIQNHD